MRQVIKRHDPYRVRFNQLAVNAGVIAVAAASLFLQKPQDDMEISTAAPDGGGFAEICIADNFKQACAKSIEEAQEKFLTNPEPLKADLFNEQANAAKKRYTITIGIPSFHTNSYQGLNYPVPAVWQTALAGATRNDPISQSVMTKVLGSESGFKNQSSHTGAFSVGQFTLSTFMETAYLHRNKLTPSQKRTVEQNIQQYNGGTDDHILLRYRIKKGGNEQNVRALANNPSVTAVLVREHMRAATKHGEELFRDQVRTRIDFMKSDKYDGPRDDNYQTRLDLLEYNLKRPMTAADVKVFYLCGSRGGSQLLFAVADPRTHHMRANDFTTKGVVNSNPDVFFKTDETPRSVYDFYNYIVHRVGNEALPDNLDRGTRMVRKPGTTLSV